MASHFHLFGVVLARFFFPQFSIVDSKTVQRSALCRSRREFSNEYLLAKVGIDTAENEPCKVCPISAYRSPRCCCPACRSSPKSSICECHDEFTQTHFLRALEILRANARRSSDLALESPSSLPLLPPFTWQLFSLLVLH